ncbi:MAG TPA: glycoside hydrolase domain-containing protein [Stellaceae bacterium]|nr:glycoside hydrolase domain-containing protein [Stellaceae bacterium]
MKAAKLIPILPALVLAACHNLPRPVPTLDPTLAVAQPRGIGPAQGVDLPTDASDVLNELKDSPIAFVARYYRDPASRWPALSPSEAQRLSSLGLKIVAVWEPHSPDPAYFSYSAGYDDAIIAYRQAKAVGQPAGSAIYFAIDFDAQALDPIDQYFRGIAAGLAAASGGAAEYKVGVYGSGTVCEAVRQAGLAQYSWLSNSIAWAGSLNYNDWNIRQGGRLAGLSFNHDADEARDDYGGFRLAQSEIAAPYAGAGPAAMTQAAVP